MNDNALATAFKLGDTVVYTKSDVLRTPNIEAYNATIISSASVSPKGVKYRIEYFKREADTVRQICAWVKASKLRARPKPR